MPEINDPKALAEYFQCLSVFENNTYELYQTLAEKTETPQIKSQFQTIAKDSQRHSKLINDMAKNISEAQLKFKDCTKKLGQVWKTTENLRKELATKQKITKADCSEMIQKLDALESSFGEEYFILIQMKTMKYLAKEINAHYNVDLNKMKNTFESIISDEDRHREVLSQIKELCINEEKEKQSNNPIVKFQNPDAWFQPLPPQTHDTY